MVWSFGFARLIHPDTQNGSLQRLGEVPKAAAGFVEIAEIADIVMLHADTMRDKKGIMKSFLKSSAVCHIDGPKRSDDQSLHRRKKARWKSLVDHR